MHGGLQQTSLRTEYQKTEQQQRIITGLSFSHNNWKWRNKMNEIFLESAEGSVQPEEDTYPQIMLKTFWEILEIERYFYSKLYVGDSCI